MTKTKNRNPINVILSLSQDDKESYTLIIKKNIKEYLKKDNKLYSIRDFILIEEMFFNRLSEYYAGQKPELHGENKDVVVDIIFVCLGHLFLIYSLNIGTDFNINYLLRVSISNTSYKYKTPEPSDSEINFYEELGAGRLLDKSGEPRINYVFYKKYRGVLKLMLYNLLKQVLNKDV